MPDLLQTIVDSNVGRTITQTLGLPTAPRLRRYEPGQPLVSGPVLVTGGGRLVDEVAHLLDAADATVVTDLPDAAPPAEPFAAVIVDATEISYSQDLRVVYDAVHASIRHLASNARVLVLAGTVAGDRHRIVAQRALEGFVRSLGKELRGGATAQLVRVAEGAEGGMASTLRFLLSSRSAYVDGQVIAVGPATATAPPSPADWDRPLDSQVAVVTGAARGIGAAIARVLARDGAHVVCVDLPAMGQPLSQVANEVGGSTLQLDITAEDAPTRLSEYLRDRHGRADIVIHNAGITRDKTVAGMDERGWEQVIAVNLAAPERLTERLHADDVLGEHARIVVMSSMNGIAGAKGQTNYATSKAGLIGLVTAWAPDLADRGATINAVAPGFIETDMTAEMPMAVREVGRRMNSLGQGGLPVDVAETVAWLAAPASGWVNGQVVRVCGQNLLGA